MSDHTHVFICGLNRSGTSLLHRLLRAHPKISGFTNTDALEDEGQHLQDVYPIAKVFGGAGKFCFDVRAHLDESSPLVTAESRARLMAQWGLYWDLSKPLLIEKSPPNLIRSRFLQAMFPQSRFLFLLRHPIPVAYATLKWARTDVLTLVRHWIAGHEAMLRDLPHLREALVMRYEDFVAAPEETLNRIYAFLSLSPQPPAESVIPGVNVEYFTQWQACIAADTQELARVRALRALPNRFGYYFVPPYVRPALQAMS